MTAFGVAQSSFDSGGNLVDANGSAINPLGYSATLTITPEALGGIASGATAAAMEVLRITVRVTFGTASDEVVVLDGYRTRYAPNAI